MPSAKTPRRIRTATPPPLPETVDPRWLLKALGAVVALGVLCSYITVCALFYHQQWQLVLHPSRAVSRTPAAAGLAFQPVRFGDNVAGQPQLAGWWIPGDLPSDPTVLLLHGQDGSMSDALPAAKALHDARLNVLLFDYRGYGKSGGDHPTAQRMTEDTTSALQYLTETRGVAPSSVIAFGTELGASLAVGLCSRHPELPGIILQSADGDTETRVVREQRSKIVPLRLFFHERFPLADPLRSLKTPKLLISYTNGHAPVDAERAANPKLTAELPPGAGEASLTAVVRRFLDTYVPRPPAALTP